MSVFILVSTLVSFRHNPFNDVSLFQVCIPSWSHKSISHKSEMLANVWLLGESLLDPEVYSPWCYESDEFSCSLVAVIYSLSKCVNYSVLSYLSQTWWLLLLNFQHNLISVHLLIQFQTWNPAPWPCWWGSCQIVLSFFPCPNFTLTPYFVFVLVLVIFTILGIIVLSSLIDSTFGTCHF